MDDEFDLKILTTQVSCRERRRQQDYIFLHAYTLSSEILEITLDICCRFMKLVKFCC